PGEVFEQNRFALEEPRRVLPPRKYPIEHLVGLRGRGIDLVRQGFMRLTEPLVEPHPMARCTISPRCSLTAATLVNLSGPDAPEAETAPSEKTELELVADNFSPQARPQFAAESVANTNNHWQITL